MARPPHSVAAYVSSTTWGPEKSDGLPQPLWVVIVAGEWARSTIRLYIAPSGKSPRAPYLDARGDPSASRLGICVEGLQLVLEAGDVAAQLRLLQAKGARRSRGSGAPVQ